MEQAIKHSHVHDPEQKKKQLNRMSKLIGHLERVKKMIEQDVDCADVLMQLAACKSAMNGLGKEIMSEHMTHCVAHAIEEKDTETINEFLEAVKKYF